MISYVRVKFEQVDYKWKKQNIVETINQDYIPKLEKMITYRIEYFFEVEYGI